MGLFGRKHLHISESDQIVNGIFKAVKSVTSGSIKLEIANQPALKIEINENDYISNSNKMAIKLDLLDPALFRIPEDETSLFDKLRTAMEFAQKLTDNGITLSLLRKGKAAITLGEEAKPTLSRIITKSDDIQLNSMKESTKLRTDFKDDKGMM
jgi:hypothetical protein